MRVPTAEASRLEGHDLSGHIDRLSCFQFELPDLASFLPVFDFPSGRVLVRDAKSSSDVEFRNRGSSDRRERDARWRGSPQS